MTFDIECNGTRRQVSVEPQAGGTRFRVVVDGDAAVVDVVRIGRYGLSLLNLATGTSREVAIVPGAGSDERLGWVDGLTAVVTVDGRRRRAAADAAGASGEQAIVAPMPGRVVRVLVAAGDRVALRQPCVVVEAMKMENELRAPRAGRVASVAVEPGMPVDAGRVLVVIE